MTKKIKLVASIGGSIFIAGGMLGAGVGIGLSVNTKTEENRIYELRRDEIIRKRTYINNLSLAAFTSRDVNGEYYKDYVWKQEYGDFLKTLYFPPENNIDISKPWYENYGPLYQSDRTYSKGKLLIGQENNINIVKYNFGPEQSTELVELSLLIDLWKVTEQDQNGNWLTELLYPCWVITTISKSFL